MRAIGMGLSLCACCAALGGDGKPQLQIAPMGVKVVPVAIAGAMLVNGEVVVTTEWRPYVEKAAGGRGGGGGLAQGGCTQVGYSACGADTLIFDVFEPHPAFGYPADLDESCVAAGVPAGSRYYFGSAVNPPNAFATNDFESCPDAEGPITGIDLAWFWGSGAMRNMTIAIFIHETFSATCTGPDASGPLGGVLINFGDRQGPIAGGMYYSNIDLHNDGLGGCLNCRDLPLPADGKGAYDVRLGQYDGVTFTLDITPGTQPMLWGDENQPVSAGASPNPIQWDDDHPRNGVHGAPAECYDYGHGLCVDPLGASIAFRTGGTCACNPCDANCDGSTNLFDIDAFVDALSSGAGCDYCTADANRDGSVNLFDIDVFVNCIAGP